MNTRPVLVKPNLAQLVRSSRTQLVDDRSSVGVSGSPLSVEMAHVRPGHAGEPDRRRNWTFLLVWQAGPRGAIVHYGPARDQINPATSQLVAIPPGVAHTIFNPNDEHDLVTYAFHTAATTQSPSKAQPFVISVNDHELAVSQQGQPIATLLDGNPGGNVAGSPISAGFVSMRPGHVAEPHQHNDTWVYVLLHESGPLGANTLYGPRFEGLIHQQPGQLLVIPPGIPHTASNPSPTRTITAFEFRANPTIHVDNIVRDDLRHYMDGQIPVLFDIPAAEPSR